MPDLTPVSPTAVTPAGGTPAPVSPTGEAILPAKYVPYALALSALPGAIAGVFMAAHVLPQAVQWLGVASGLFLGLLGVVSPGLRRQVPPVGIVALVGLCLLGATPVLAQGFRYGPSASLLEIRPGLSSPIALAPGVGVEGSYEWQRWSAGLVVYGSALQLVGGTGQSTSEVSAAPIVCLKGPGLCVGPLFVLGGPNGGVFRDFTWRRSVGAVFSASGDLLAWLTALGATAPQ